MPKQKRYRTDYPGVYYIKGKMVSTGKPEKIFYIMYRKNGKQIHEKAGRQFKDNMTPAKAANKRVLRMSGKELSNQERRDAEKAKKLHEKGRWTFARLLEEFNRQNPDRSSLATDTSNWKHLEPYLAEKEPKDLILLDVQRIRKNLEKTHAVRTLKKDPETKIPKRDLKESMLTPQTIKHILSLLSRLANFGKKQGICEGLSFKVEMPRVDNIKTEDLTPAQLKRLLDTIEADDHPHAGPMMKMVLFTGMRRGELFKLKWEDINFEKGFITLRDPKGGPDQKIPLNDAVRDLLGSLRKTRSPYVFPGHKGKQLKSIVRPVNKIKKAAELPQDFRPFHGLRHVYASMLISSGQVDMYTLQKLLTHKDPTMTQRYAHLRDDPLRKASSLAGNLINALSTNADVVDLNG